ncbi:MAG: hypothetical protein Q8P26_02435, partial [Candidatus Levybacteria bacterium]|nr:hypothetical protein [Candidatus Levybacteria bacterium]
MLNILKKLSDTILQHRIIILTIAILILTSLIQTQKNKDFAYAQEGDEKYYVTISPSAKTVNINEEFDAELTINKSPPKNISTVEIKIEYDPDILNLEITSPPKCTETKISDCVMDFSDNIYLFSVDQNKVDLGT